MQDNQNVNGMPGSVPPNPMPVQNPMPAPNPVPTPNPMPVPNPAPIPNSVPVQPAMPSPEVSPVIEKPTKKNRLWLIIILVVVLVGAGVAAAIMLWPSGDPQPTPPSGQQDPTDDTYVSINERIQTSDEKVDPETIFYKLDGTTITVREMISQYANSSEAFYPQDPSSNRYATKSNWGEGDNNYLEDLMILIGQPNSVYQNYSPYQDDESMMTGYGLLAWEVKTGGYLIVAVNDFTNWKGYGYEYYTLRFTVRPLANATELNNWVQGFAKAWEG